MRRRETPYAPIPYRRGPTSQWRDPIGDWTAIWSEATPPTNPYAALMATPPGGIAAMSAVELQPVRELIQDAIDQLDPIERYVFDAWVVQRMSFRAIERETAALEAAGLGVRLPRSSAMRARDRAVVALRLALQNEPLILRMLKG